MDDNRIIDLFFERDQQSIAELKNKYGANLFSISHKILNDKRDAEECENDTYLAVWNAIPPERPNPLLTFVLKITRNLALKKYHNNTAKKRNSHYDVALSELENCIPDTSLVEDEYSVKELTEMIERFLDMQLIENRVMFVRRYWFSDSIKEISEVLKISERNVTVRLSRIRERLKEHLQKEGVTLWKETKYHKQ